MAARRLARRDDDMFSNKQDRTVTRYMPERCITYRPYITKRGYRVYPGRRITMRDLILVAYI
jgi:hypothetical protein